MLEGEDVCDGIDVGTDVCTCMYVGDLAYVYVMDILPPLTKVYVYVYMSVCVLVYVYDTVFVFIYVVEGTYVIEFTYVVVDVAMDV